MTMLEEINPALVENPGLIYEELIEILIDKKFHKDECMFYTRYRICRLLVRFIFMKLMRKI